MDNKNETFIYIFSFIVLVVIYLNLTFYKNIHKSAEIIQTTAENFMCHLLLEKKPVIINSQIVDKKDFLKKTCSIYFQSYKNNIIKNNHICKNKYTALYDEKKDKREIILTHPNKESFKFILYKDTILMLPYGWKIETKKNINIIKCNDIITLLYTIM